jgi:DNA primase
MFNLHRAAPAARKSGRIVAVEGQMDVVALAAAGIEEAVAPMGTALTEQQIELMWRVADKPVLCFDGDAAGQRAAMRAIGRVLPLLRPGHSLQFVTLPAGMDPDDLIKREGRAALERLLESPKSLVETLWERERDALPLASPEDKAGLKARLLDHVEAIQHPDIRALYKRELLERFSDFAFPQREARQLRDARPQPGKRWGQLLVGSLAPGSAERLKRNSRDGLARAVLAGLVRHPGEIARHTEDLLGLAAAEPRRSREIDALLDWSARLEGARDGTISPPSTLSPAPDNTPFSFLIEGTDPQAAREDLAEAVALLVDWPALDAAFAAATARLESDPEGSIAEQQRLGKRKLELQGRLGQMARKRAASAALKD